jgi:Na+-transporting NADH:ubiquinone oxidoreductase subunit C
MRIIGFAAAVCVVCSLLLSAAAVTLGPLQQANRAHDMNLNILRALGVRTVGPDGEPLSKDAVARIFEDSITTKVLDRNGNVVADKDVMDLPRDERNNEEKEYLPLYVFERDGVHRYCFPVTGRGLWSTLYGYLAVEDDLATIAGLTFYAHGETPGLGAEISEPWFSSQFTNEVKELYTEGEPVDFRVMKSRGMTPPGTPHAVDGPSGATMTSKGVQALLNADFALYNRYFETLRN